jgi:phosphohistidine phosphatase
MYLYLIQHGEAKSKEEDPERPLSEQGINDVTKVARMVPPLGISRIFHSGKLRAEQTAVIYGKHIGAEVSETDGLNPMDDPATWANHLKDEGVDTMLVGHLPHLGKLASLLLCANPDAEAVAFRMGGVLCLEKTGKPQNPWTFQWMLIPEMLP